MTSLTASLGAGILVLIIAFLLLYRFTPMNGKQSSMVASMVAIISYLPFAMHRWPGADVVTIHIAIYGVLAYVLGIIMSSRDERLRRGEAQSGKWFHWGPALIVMFFMVIIATDTVFVTLAINGLPKGIERDLLPAALAAKAPNTEFPGLVHDHYWQKETAFNAFLERVAVQRQRGWHVRKGWLTDEPRAGRPAVFQLAVTDRDGKPITGASVHGLFLRPSDSRFDHPFTMSEVGGGFYRVSLVLPKPGMWDVELKVRKGKATYEMRASTSILTSGMTASR